MVENPVQGESKELNGVLGVSEKNDGVLGVSKAPGKAGVAGVNEIEGGGNGIYGRGSYSGVYGLGTSSAGSGVVGVSDFNDAVLGVSKASGKAGVAGVNENGGNGIYGRGSVNGVVGISDFNDAVLGVSKAKGHAGVAGVNTCVGSGAGSGVYGHSDDGVGVWGMSNTYEGVHAETKSTSTAAMAAYQMEPTSDTAALYAKHAGNRTAAFFEGNVIVTGDITLANADCAEHFEIADADSIEPGTVTVLGDDESLHRSCHPYDKRVAGVVSGAGAYKPGIILDKQETKSNRKPIALLGKVYCKVDAQFGAIAVGDLLTTSSTPGHAMRADDPMKAFGAVIGKALRPLKEGQGMIPILIALQ